jgi:sugar (pentulose or hexulose) kinase
MGQPMKFIAFDLGASSGRVAVASYDGSHIRLENVHSFPNGATRLADGLYWDFIGIWNGYLSGIREGLSRYPEVRSVGACTYCNDFSFVDRDGALLAPVRSYRDRRTVRTEDYSYSIMSREELYSVSGNQIAPFNTLMQLSAMKAEGNDFVLSHADNLLFLPDLLTFYLCGERVTERSIASVTQMYDHGASDWSCEVLERFGIGRGIFAPFASAGTVAGTVSPSVLEGIGIPARRDIKAVVTAEHDTASAFMAARADENTLVISSGTWSLAGCESAGPVISDFGFRHNIANEGGIEGHHRLIRNVMGNWIMQEVLREYGPACMRGGFAKLDAEAARLDPYRFVIDVDAPAFFEPLGMREKISGVCMEKYGAAPSSPAEFAVCVGTSLAMKYRWAMEKLAQLRGRDFGSINIIGGGSNDSLTAQRTADVTGLPVVCGPADASVFGNVIFQLIASGEISEVGEGRAIVGSSVDFRHFEPALAARDDAAYKKFLSDFSL